MGEIPVHSKYKGDSCDERQSNSAHRGHPGSARPDAMPAVSILLTQYADPFSRMVYYLTGRGYTHVSISPGEDGSYYSFNLRGFCRETLERHRRRGPRRSMALRLEVSDASFRGIRRRLRLVDACSQQYHYNSLGVFCAMLHIPFRRRRCYFCSQFVAELLADSGAMALPRPAGFYLPGRLLDELLHAPNLTAVEENIV